jgi:hypothetical protein
MKMSPNPAEPGSSFNRYDLLTANEATEGARRGELVAASGCLLARSGSILRCTFCFSLVVALLFVTAHRLPAPIQEVPESPTPTPEQQAKPKKTQSKSKAIESESKAKSAPKASATPMLQGPARFAGTWTGTINQGILGDIPITLVVNSEGTSLVLKWSGGQEPHPTSYSGNTLSWRAGWLNEITWTLTPAGDGKTAAVTSNSGFGVNGAAIFRR